MSVYCHHCDIELEVYEYEQEGEGWCSVRCAEVDTGGLWLEMAMTDRKE